MRVHASAGRRALLRGTRAQVAACLGRAKAGSSELVLQRNTGLMWLDVSLIFWFACDWLVEQIKVTPSNLFKLSEA